MAHIERSVHIEERPEEVFRILTDLRLIPRWAVIAQDTYIRPESDLTGAGQEFHWTIHVAGIDLETDWVVSEYERPRVVAYKVESPHQGRLEMTQRVLDAGDGGSRVELQVDYDLPYGFLGEALDRAVVERRNQVVVERSLQNLKELVEAIKDYRAAA
jgi:uncharacterized protein YndB with AHSA1/START domain